MRSVKMFTMCVIATVLVCGCGSATVNTTTSTVSIGQQLIDLQNSFNSGAMNADQYKKAKQDLIKRVVEN
jgi:hypothetical protein